MLPSEARMLVGGCLQSWANWALSRSVEGGLEDMGGSILDSLGGRIDFFLYEAMHFVVLSVGGGGLLVVVWVV